MPIYSQDYLNRRCGLVDENNNYVLADTALTCSKGVEYILKGGSAPHKYGSTGKVWVENDGHCREFHPTVFNLHWEAETETDPDYDRWMFESEKRHTEAGIL